MSEQLFIATRNAGKKREIRAILQDLPYVLRFLDESGIVEHADEALLEEAESFEGNARRKAHYFARRTGSPTVADDSGLEVFALGGAPGVRSRRFALFEGPPDEQDKANNAHLLSKLSGLPEERRRARYRCVVAFVPRPDAPSMTFEGTCTGNILEAPKGSGGFGYDPLFFSDDLQQGFGEAKPEDKDAVSHRGRAFRAFADWLKQNPLA
jgi:XTP/dITP diphosphohydrolase